MHIYFQYKSCMNVHLWRVSLFCALVASFDMPSVEAYILISDNRNHTLIEWGGVNLLNATFSNISIISWQSVLLLRKPGYQEKTTDLPQVTDKTLSDDTVSNTHCHEPSSKSQL